MNINNDRLNFFLRKMKHIPAEDRQAVAQRAIENQNRIYALLRSTGENGIEELIADIHASSFSATHPHRHHHYATGLMEHLIGTYEAMAEYSAIFEEKGIHTDPKEVILVGLLHDLCDAKLDKWDSIEHGRHAIRSAAIVQKYLPDVSEEVLGAIRGHMGIASKAFFEDFSNQARLHPLRALVLLSDSQDAARFPKNNHFEQPIGIRGLALAALRAAQLDSL